MGDVRDSGWPGSWPSRLLQALFPCPSLTRNGLPVRRNGDRVHARSPGRLPWRTAGVRRNTRPHPRPSEMLANHCTALEAYLMHYIQLCAHPLRRLLLAPMPSWATRICGPLRRSPACLQLRPTEQGHIYGGFMDGPTSGRIRLTTGGPSCTIASSFRALLPGATRRLSRGLGGPRSRAGWDLPIRKTPRKEVVQWT